MTVVPGPVAAGSLVAVTGANGFIGSYVVEALLGAGFRVRCTVRDPDDASKTQHLRDLAAASGTSDRLELVAADLLTPGSFGPALAGCDGVVHCAAAVAFSAADPQRDLVDPSVLGTRNVLDGARSAGTVKRVVHTSSMAAIYDWSKPDAYVFTEADWNTASTLQTDPYAFAKTEGERAALAFVASMPASERFELVHLNPGMVWGPPMIRAHAKASPSLVRDVISRTRPGLPRLMMSVVDVRDVAVAHVRALRHPDPPPRCLLAPHNGWLPEQMAELQAMFPEVRMGTRTIPKLAVLWVSLFDKSLSTRQLQKLIGRSMPMDSSLSRKAYDMQYRSLEDTLRDTATPMIANGWARVTKR